MVISFHLCLCPHLRLADSPFLHDQCHIGLGILHLQPEHHENERCFAGLNNIDLNAPGHVLQNTQIDFRGNFITSQGILWNLIYLFSIALVVIGFTTVIQPSRRCDTVKGNLRFFQAVAGIILIVGVPTLVHVFIAKGADQVGGQPVVPGETLKPFSLQGLVGPNGIEYPENQALEEVPRVGQLRW